MVMLEWGSCGQIATAVPDVGADEILETGDDVDESCLGYVLYAPPRTVPRAAIPTGPVSADAVLLTSLGIEQGHSDGLAQSMLAHVVNELVRRGVPCAGGHSLAQPNAPTTADGHAVTPELEPVLEVLGDCSFDQCMVDEELLKGAGFTVVAPHRYFPRLRLELDKGLGWKAEVEAALERLLEAAAQQPVGCRAELPS